MYSRFALVFQGRIGNPSYIFLQLRRVLNTLDEAKLTDADRKIVDAMICYWFRFPKAGNPNANDLHHWPAYSKGADQHLVIDTESSVDSGLRCDACDLLDRALDSRAREAEVVGAGG